MENIINTNINNIDVERENLKNKYNINIKNNSKPQIQNIKEKIKNNNNVTRNDAKKFTLPYTNIIKYIISGFVSYNTI